MTNSDQKREILFLIENPEIEALANELVQLKPNFKVANTDNQRSLEILKAFDNAKLSAFEKKEILGFIRYHWGAAATAQGLADARKLMSSQAVESHLPQPELIA